MRISLTLVFRDDSAFGATTCSVGRPVYMIKVGPRCQILDVKTGGRNKGNKHMNELALFTSRGNILWFRVGDIILWL